MYEGITLVAPWPMMMTLKGVEEGGKVEARVRRYCWQSWRGVCQCVCEKKKKWSGETYTAVEVSDEDY